MKISECMRVEYFTFINLLRLIPLEDTYLAGLDFKYVLSVTK